MFLFLLVIWRKVKVENGVTVRLFKGKLGHRLAVDFVQNRLKFLNFPHQLPINLFQLYNFFLHNLFLSTHLFILIILLNQRLLKNLVLIILRSQFLLALLNLVRLVVVHLHVHLDVLAFVR